jgi:hypothetical protein
MKVVVRRFKSFGYERVKVKWMSTLVPTKSNHPVTETKQSNFSCFEQGLPVSIYFVW